MIDNHVENKKSPKFYVKNYLTSIKDELKGKTVVDIPAGNGATTEILLGLGAEVKPFDLFPEYFMVENIECKRVDIMKGIPLEDQDAHFVICQEGIEHFSDQLKVFKEFNRILKKDGRLIITTPSYSNLAAKLSYMLFESEIGKKMPPNEIDDIWMSDKSISMEIYYGHIFLIGLQKLRVIAKLSGFEIVNIKFTRISKGSLFLFIFIYPLILIRSIFTYLTNLKKRKWKGKSTYKEQFLININPKNLLNRHLLVDFKKTKDDREVESIFQETFKQFNQIM